MKLGFGFNVLDSFDQAAPTWLSHFNIEKFNVINYGKLTTTQLV